MVEWLEGRANGPSNLDLWGREKPFYTFVDLVKWFEVMADNGEDSSDGGKRKSKKVLKKMERSSSPPLKDGKRKHKAKAKSTEMLKKGSKK